MSGWGFTLAGVALLACCVEVAPQTAVPSVFSNRTVKDAIPTTLQGRGVKRIRAVVVNTRLFTNVRPPLTMKLNFFPDANLIVRWTRAEGMTQPPGSIWTGRIEGRDGEAMLTIAGQTVTGNFSRGDGVIYQVRTTEDNKHWVREVNQQAFPRESEPLSPTKRPQ